MATPTKSQGTHAAALLLLTGLLALAPTAACKTTVGLSSDRYAPQFDPAPLANYRGRALVLRGFQNADENTSFYLYPGDGRRYGGPVLASYFWYCFKAAFIRLGVNVFEEGQAIGIPVMDVKLIHVAEDGFTVDATVTGPPGQPPMQKRYAIRGPAIATADADALEQRAYRMMSEIFWAVVSDPEVQAAVLR